MFLFGLNSRIPFISLVVNGTQGQLCAASTLLEYTKTIFSVICQSLVHGAMCSSLSIFTIRMWPLGSDYLSSKPGLLLINEPALSCPVFSSIKQDNNSSHLQHYRRVWTSILLATIEEILSLRIKLGMAVKGYYGLLENFWFVLSRLLEISYSL